MASASTLGRVEALVDQIEKANSTVAKHIGEIEGGLSASDRKLVESETATELLAAKRALDELKAAMRGLKKTDRRTLGSRPDLCRSDFETQRKRFAAAKQAATRSELMGGASSEKSRAERDRLRTTQASLDGTTDHLADAHRTLTETISRGVATVDTMTSQTSSLLRTKEHVEGTQLQADIAGGTVTDIRRRAWTNKCILAIAMLLLLGANIAVLLYGHILTDSGSSGNSGKK